MKKQFLTIVLMMVTSVIFAQCPVDEGQIQINGGFGFSDWGIPVYVGIDYGIDNDVTVGGQLSFRSFKENWDAKSYSSTMIGVSLNGTYHFNRLLDISKEWDVYAGIEFGYNIWNNPSGYPGNHTSGLGFGMQYGGRYYFNNNWGINLEFGVVIGSSSAQIGVSYRL